jgi:2-oxoglutarate dehydrogenase E1 component
MARQDINEALAQTGFLYGGNAAYIEDLYARYQADPKSVDEQWQGFFAGLKDEGRPSSRTPRAPPGRSRTGRSRQWRAGLGARRQLGRGREGRLRQARRKAKAAGADLSAADVQQATRDSVRAIMLIRAYRMRGHLHAKLDPLGIEQARDPEEFSPAAFGFTEADLDRKIFIDNVLGMEFATIREMTAILQRTYCSTVGIEFMHISDPEQKAWLQERIEGPDKEIAFTREGKKAILNKLVEAEGFEKFIDLKYTGTKRFGLDGAESLIPALEQIIKRGGALGVRDIVFGMAHRGRLNVLTQVLGKPHRALFHEFKGGSFAPDDVEGSGDVKYHLGASATASSTATMSTSR